MYFLPFNRIHQRILNVEISFASNSVIIKDNTMNAYISLESFLNINNLVSTSVRNQLKSYFNFQNDVNLSASIY